MRIAGGHFQAKSFPKGRRRGRREWRKGEKDRRQTRTENIFLVSDACRGLSESCGNKPEPTSGMTLHV